MFRNSVFYFLALLGLVIIGFWQSYFSNYFGNIDRYTHFHAITMLLWVTMLITQALLIRYNNHSLHRFIGRLSYGLFPLLVISLVLLAHNQLSGEGNDIPYFRYYVLFLQLSLLAIFIIAYGLAIANRKSPAHHARYMICTALTLIDPAVARIPLDLPTLPFTYQVLTFSLTDLIIIVLIVMERKQKRGRFVFPFMLSIFLTFQILNLTATHSAIWEGFTEWFAHLPLT